MAYYIWKSYKLNIAPLRIFEILSRQKHCFFLDSSLNGNYSAGRYSFLGIEPFLVLKLSDEGSFEKLRQVLNKYSFSLPRNKIPFLGGAVGYFTYDLGLKLEKKILPRKKEDPKTQESFFGFYNSLVIIDHLRRKLHIFCIGFPEKNGRLAELAARENFRNITGLLLSAGAMKNPPAERENKEGRLRQYKSNLDKESYIRALNKAKDYIRAGDIYQVNLSQEFRATTDLAAPEIYRRLRKISPSYFSAYLDDGSRQIISSSPERFLGLSGNTVTTCPMKGTRARGRSRAEDKILGRELLSSIKDKAELMMIVDLERNDLGRVCDYGSIKVKTLRQLEKYNTVFQATAEIYGRLHPDKDRIDLLRACFPGGSITGCPKIRAMEIIDELEPHRRGVYTGNLGYFSFSGNMDFNILIRTIVKEADKVYFSSGGGIVADSLPEAEYQETLIKAKAMTQAIR